MPSAATSPAARTEASSRSTHGACLINAVVVVVVWGLFVVPFSQKQELWVDETTQLRGLSLDMLEMTRWLAGVDQGRFDVPGDRMPPLSYWVGWIWSRVLGLNDSSLRWLSMLVVAVAAVWIVMAARRTWGARAGYAAGLAFAASANVVTYGVEIRAYPFLLLFSVGAFDQMLRALSQQEDSSRRHWVGLVLTCLAAIYSHFFGLVLSGAVICGAIGYLRMNRRSIRDACVAGGVILVGALGTIPFLRAAIRLSTGARPPSASYAGDLGRLLFRVFGGHPSGRVMPGLAELTIAGALVLVAMAVRRAPRRALVWSVLVALVSGLVAASAARLLFSGFTPLSPTYNCWAVPAICLLVGAGANAWACAVGNRIVAVLGIAALAAGTLGSSAMMLRHASHFAHTAGDRLAENIRRAGGPSDCVVLLDSSSSWGDAYFPLRYRFGDQLRQYLFGATRAEDDLEQVPMRHHTRLRDLQSASDLWVVKGITMDTRAIAASIRTPLTVDRRSDPLRQLQESVGEKWLPVSSELLPAYGGLQVTHYRRQGVQ